ncbi:glycosyltransferase family 2 protein [Sphingomonas montanisoli]|uniref:Glycosyltransferase family 2 protein n=2 Tax=Sphingomonas montanisoli TaxID=2606412 RepID=A0A5D9CHA2_9SPHN|nr:glycosyltransferase family 2 protein [Sphingomonas montanisoli]
MGTQIMDAGEAAAGTPALSVIVPAYGVTTMLADALNSLRAQTRDDWEAIVIDDGDARVAEYFEPFSGDPRIRLLRTENGGLPVARNRAIAEARAPLISLLDADDTYMPHYVARMIAAIEASAKRGVVSCDATYFGHDRVGERFSTYVPQRPPVNLGRLIRREFNVFICATLRRDAVLEVGGFDPTLKSAEDLDLWLRLAEAGWEVGYVPEALARYRRRPGQMSSNVPVMLQSALTVYTRAAERLGNRPEASDARAMCRQTERAIAAEEGLDRIREGATGEGVSMLRSAAVHERSARWRIAMVLIRALPFLAGPLIRFRDRV